MAVNTQQIDPRTTTQNPAIYGQIDRIPNAILEFALTFLRTSEACQFKLTRYLYLTQLSFKDCILHLKNDAADDAAVAKAIEAARKYRWQFTTVIVSGEPTFLPEIRSFQKKWEDIKGLTFEERNRIKATFRTFPIFSEKSIELLAVHPLKGLGLKNNIVMLSARAFELLGKISTLTHLEIASSHNYQMSDTDLSYLSQLKLRTLITHNSEITDEGYKYLQGMPLESLEMLYTEKGTHKCLKYLQGIPLRKLNIQSGYFSLDAVVIRSLHLGSKDAVLAPVLQAIPTLEVLGYRKITADMRQTCQEWLERRQQAQTNLPQAPPTNAVNGILPNQVPVPQPEPQTADAPIANPIPEITTLGVNGQNLEPTQQHHQISPPAARDAQRASCCIMSFFRDLLDAICRCLSCICAWCRN